jgi:glycosyltransferase involved in cell wall biosynthesis
VKVLAVFHLGDVNGPSNSLDRELTVLAGHDELHVLVPSHGSLVEHYSRFARVSVAPYTTLTRPRGGRGAARQLARMWTDVGLLTRHVRAIRPDLVVVVTSMLPAALVAARLAGRPSVAYVSEILDRPGSPVGPSLQRWVLRRATYALAGAVVCASRAVAAQFGPQSNGRVVTAYPRIDASYAAGDRRAARKRWDIPPGATCVAVAGAISRGRGQDVAIRALAEARGRLPGARLLIAGSPHPRDADRSYERELRDLVSDLGVDDAVRFLGHVRDMPDLYAASDIVINPARIDEAFGRVAAEALLAGRPVVSTNVGAVPEVFRAGTDAILVPTDDPGAISRALVELAGDQPFRDRLTHAGRARVNEVCREDLSIGGVRAAAAHAMSA